MIIRPYLSWAAGLFEGEGSVSVSNRRLQINLVSTDLDVLDSFARTFGWGQINGPYSYNHKPHWKPQWAFTASGKVAYAILVSIWPWLHERRQEQVRAAICSWLSVPAHRGGPKSMPYFGVEKIMKQLGDHE